MQRSVRLAVLLLALVAVPCVVCQGHGHSDSHDTEDSHAPAPVHSSPAAHSPSAGHSSAAGTALADSTGMVEKKGFNGMYFGLLTTFVILFTIFMFLYFFEYEVPGNSIFYTLSYITLILFVCSGLSSYFTASILAALLATSILLVIAFGGFMAMTTVSSPDRFEGDKSNMGRTKLD